MSIRSLLEPPIKAWANMYANVLNTNEINTVNIDTNTINNLPIPSGGIDPNPANVIYRPGSVNPTDSNVVSTWAEVVAKADNINVNECLNVYIDNSIVDPAPIDQSLDCKGRVRLLSHTYSAGAFTNARIIDGVTLTNPREISGTLGIECESLTSPNIILSDGSILIVREGAFLTNSSSALVPSLQIGDGNFNVFSVALGGRMGTSATGVPLINIGISSTLFFNNLLDTTGQTYISDSISSTDGTGNIFLVVDASVDVALFVNSGFTGTVAENIIDKALNVSYDDSLQLPESNSSNTQGVIDWLKTQIGGGGSPTDIIYRDGVITSGNLVGSWQEVLDICDANNQFVNVCVDSSDTECFASVSHDFQGRTSFYARSGNYSSGSVLKIQNGILLKNIRQISGPLTLLGNNQGGGASLSFDPNNVFYINDWASLDINVASTGPIIDISTGQNIEIQLSNYGSIIYRGIPYINIGIGSTLGLTLFTGSSVQEDSITSSDASGVLNVYRDATSTFNLPQTGYLGTPNIQLADSSSYVDYVNNVLISPINLNALNAQEAIDSLKNMTKSIIYRPGIALSSRNVLKTWAEVISLCSKNNNLLDIYFDDSVFSPCPIDVSYDFKGGVTFKTINNNFLSPTKIQIANATQIQNLKGIYGMITLTSDNANGQPTMLWDANKFFEVYYATLDNTAGSTGPYINVSTTWQFSIYNRASLKASGGHPIAISVGAGAQMAMSSIVGCDVQSNCISGTPTSILFLVNDASQVTQTQAVSFPIGLTMNNVDNADFVKYNDTSVNPPLNASTVQEAIDALKTNTPATKPTFNVSTQTKSNVSGDGTQYTVLFDVIDHDPNNMYNALTGRFTVPTSGTYVITSNLIVGPFSNTQTEGSYKLVDQGGTIHELTEFNPYPIGFNSPGLNVNMRFSKVVYLTVGTQLYCELTVSGGTPTCNISVGALGDRYCYFSASML